MLVSPTAVPRSVLEDHVNLRIHTERMRSLLLVFKEHALNLGSFILGFNFGQGFSSTSWSEWFLLLSSLPDNIQHVRFEILVHDKINATTAPLPDPCNFQATLRRFPSLRTFTLRWGFSQENLDKGLGNILTRRISELLLELTDRDILRTEVCMLNDLHRRSGVPMVEANNPRWLNRRRMAWD